MSPESTSCGLQFWDEFQAWLMTAPIVGGEWIPETIIWYTESGTRRSVLTQEGHTPYHYPEWFPWKATSPCCNKCTVTAGEVQVFHWPAATTTQDVTEVASSSTFINSNNFTFVSPSIYVAFQSLYAVDYCSTRSMFKPTTLAFNVSELSTVRGWKWDTTKYMSYPPVFTSVTNGLDGPLGDRDWTQATWGLTDCSYTTSSFWQWNGATPRYNEKTDALVGQNLLLMESTRWHYYTASYNPCSPILSAPPQVLTLNPEWSTCIQNIIAFWDPPSALTSASGLRPTSLATKTPQDEKQTSTSPSAGSPVPQITPSRTEMPVAPLPTSPLATSSPPTQSPNGLSPTALPVPNLAENTPVEHLPEHSPAQNPTGTPNDPESLLPPSLDQPAAQPTSDIHIALVTPSPTILATIADLSLHDPQSDALLSNPTKPLGDDAKPALTLLLGT
ncbi:hypothetical protein B0O99DRAFT_588829 [Bisporella sp. PMI_857]|nr:hypothetical protein B0O99DRAFT_588829 [Bisporella sp. PMI_857]